MAEKQQDFDQRVRELAYSMWEGEGRPDGREQEHWHRARERLGAGRGSPEPRMQPPEDRKASRT